MANKIQVRRGVVANLPTLSAGEPAFTTDTNDFYMGNGTSNIKLAKDNKIGDLSGLPTTDKSSLVNSIKEINTQLSDKVNNSDVVTVATANKLLKLDANKKLPASITGDANSVGGVTAIRIPIRTTGDINYYINPTTGSDSANDGLTSGTPFKTIAKAINMLPQIINHNVIIHLASGTTYNETVYIIGLGGAGSLTVVGGTDTTTALNYGINALSISRNSLPVTIQGITLNTTSGYSGITVDFCTSVTINYCNDIANSTARIGIVGSFSNIYVSNCQISNKNTAIIAYNGIIASSYNSGSNNSVGLNASNASTIGKYGTQPSGITNEVINGGGVIR